MGKNLNNNILIQIGAVRPQLIKCWIVLSTRQITTQPISIRGTNYAIHWIEIYLVDGIIHFLIQQGAISRLKSLFARVLPIRCC